jgi:hypothetical protein
MEGNGEIHPLMTGVYTFGSSVSIEQDITFEGTNKRLHHSDIRWSDSGREQKVLLTGGALAENIFWQVAEIVEVGVGAEMQGILLWASP